MIRLLTLPILFIAFSFSVYSQNNETINLPLPQKNLGVDIMESFQLRASAKLTDFTTKDISIQELSDILWAGNGVNRPESGKRTAPSALNSQEIDIYICREDGVFMYFSEKHCIKKINDEDIRQFINGRQHTKAPTILLLVANMERYKNYKKGDSKDNERILSMSAIDAGIVSQNIALMCAALGVKTRPRASMMHEEILKAIAPKEDSTIWLNMPLSK